MRNSILTNDDWVHYLQDNGIVEDSREEEKKKLILTLLNNVIPNFIKRCEYVKDVKCVLSPFGSYGLSAYIRNADIDLVLICPSQVTRSDFNRHFPTSLRDLPTTKNVELIKNATVPIVKFEIDSIPIDISFIQLPVKEVGPDIDLLDDSLMNDDDPACKASMDGPRTNKFIKQQIRPENVFIFQRSLQCIKHWASERGIYNKPVGYLNGSTWTFLLLKTYMREKNKPEPMTITRLLYAFFDTWANWSWQAPVMLTPFIPGKFGQRLDYNSLNEFRNTVMPIVSPCYPVCNSAPYVTKSTLKIMTKEFERGCIILEDENASAYEMLSKLFSPVNYFKRYLHFITIVTSSTGARSDEIWTRKMAVKMHRLVQMIEASNEMKQIQPIIKPCKLDRNFRTIQEKRALQNGASIEEAKAMGALGSLQPGTIYLTCYFIGVKPKRQGETIDLTSETSTFLKILESERVRNDNDVSWSIRSMKRREVFELIEEVNENNSKK